MSVIPLDPHGLRAPALQPPRRPDCEHVLAPFTEAPLARPRSLLQRLVAQGPLRRGLVLLVLGLLWEGGARWADNELLFPSLLATTRAFAEAWARGELAKAGGHSLAVLLQGYLLGIVAAFALTGLAVSSRFGREVLSTLTGLFNPLPAIALLPLALLWFGLGSKSLLFVLVHAVLWPLALNMLSGFESVPETLRMAGRNMGLRGPRYVAQILVPAALPALLTGLKIGWAFAWRTLIAAELVFGTTSGQGGLGWFIFQNRNELYTDRVFAGLATVILIGLAVETLVFASIERLTVRRWGLQR